MKKEKIPLIFKLFWILVIGSLLGCVLETIVAFVQKGSFQIRQGLLYGPFIPVYGVGLVVYYLIISRIKQTSCVFISSMILGGVVEYLFSYFQETIFGTISWDYSWVPLNLNGRTSILHCLYWGVAGILFVKWLLPWMNTIISRMCQRKMQYFTICVTVLMVINIGISTLAGIRQKERLQHKMPENTIEVLLDKYYPDHIMNLVFSNKITK